MTPKGFTSSESKRVITTSYRGFVEREKMPLEVLTGLKDANLVRVSIDWITGKNIAEILEIERDSFGAPWSGEDFIDLLCLDHHIGIKLSAFDKRNGPGVIPQEILGYAVYRNDDWRIELLNLAVRKDRRRIGVGRMLLEHIMAKVSPVRKRARVTCTVNERNEVAHYFLRSLRWTAYDVHRNFYTDGTDAYSFRYMPRQNSIL